MQTRVGHPLAICKPACRFDAFHDDPSSWRCGVCYRARADPRFCVPKRLGVRMSRVGRPFDICVHVCVTCPLASGYGLRVWAAPSFVHANPRVQIGWTLNWGHRLAGVAVAVPALIALALVVGMGAQEGASPAV